MKNKTKKENRGGARPNSGRPKNKAREELAKVIKDLKDHANEVVGMRDKVTNKIIRKKRIQFLLDTLYTVAINDKNIYAIKEYLDRAIGKSTQYIETNTQSKDIDDVKEQLKQLTKSNVKRRNKNITRPIQNRRKKGKRDVNKRTG